MRAKLIILIAMVLSVFAVMGCDTPANTPSLNDQRLNAVAGRAKAFERAERLHEAPITENFPLRASLAEYTRRTDLVNHPWYVYLLGDNGNAIGYYVAKTKPINSCAFLSSSESIHSSSTGKVILTAPSLDGMYYGGGGASAGCSSFFFEDFATGAIVEIGGLKYFVADQPLAIEAEPISVSSQ